MTQSPQKEENVHIYICIYIIYRYCVKGSFWRTLDTCDTLRRVVRCSPELITLASTENCCFFMPPIPCRRIHLTLYSVLVAFTPSSFHHIFVFLKRQHVWYMFCCSRTPFLPLLLCVYLVHLDLTHHATGLVLSPLLEVRTAAWWRSARHEARCTFACHVQPAPHRFGHPSISNSSSRYTERIGSHTLSCGP